MRPTGVRSDSIYDLAYAATFLGRRSLRAAIVFVGALLAWTILAEWLIPAGPLTASFFKSLRWAAQQGPRDYNDMVTFTRSDYSLSLVPAALGLLRWTSWQTVQRVKLMILAVILGTATLTHLRSRDAETERHVLWAAASVCVTLAPNLVWLHHEVFLIPAFWFLSTGQGGGVKLLTIAAMAIFQLTRVAGGAATGGIFEIRSIFFFAAGELLILSGLIIAVINVYRRSTPRF